ncbi:MAG: type II toxin-antitoxin system RelE/ParE family toxin [Dehalococcoidia bacterium]
MPPVRYAFVRRADRDMARLPADVRRRVFAALDRYVAEPRAADVKKLSGQRDVFRLRAGDHRILFEFGDGGTTAVVLRVLPRGRAYRD